MTDRDLRTRVVAAGTDPDVPVSQVMSAPAYTVTADRIGSEVLLDMLDRGIRHFPVLAPDGRVVGVVEDSDLVAVATRSSFHLRQAIARADTAAEVAAACAGLRPAIVALHDARVAATDISAIESVVIDAATRRLLDLTVGEPPVPFAWIALGSVARREAVPSSDIDSALVWYTDDEDPELKQTLLGLAGRVMDGLADCGFKTDPKGAIASKPLFARSHAQWVAAVNGWIDEPDAGEGADPRLARGRRPARVGHPDRSAGARRVPRRPAQAWRCCACSRSSRSRTGRPRASCAASSSRTRASTAAGSTSSAAGSSRSPTSPAGPGSPPA